MNLTIKFQQPDGTIREVTDDRFSHAYLSSPEYRRLKRLEAGYMAATGLRSEIGIKKEIPAQTQKQFTYRLLLGERPAPVHMLIYNEPPGELYIFKVGSR